MSELTSTTTVADLFAAGIPVNAGPLWFHGKLREATLHQESFGGQLSFVTDGVAFDSFIAPVLAQYPTPVEVRGLSGGLDGSWFHFNAASGPVGTWYRAELSMPAMPDDRILWGFEVCTGPVDKQGDPVQGGALAICGPDGVPLAGGRFDPYSGRRVDESFWLGEVGKAVGTWGGDYRSAVIVLDDPCGPGQLEGTRLAITEGDPAAGVTGVSWEMAVLPLWAPPPGWPTA